MPRDVPLSFVEAPTPHPRAAEIAVCDAMERLLEKSSRWCRDRLYHTRWAGWAKPALCLHGALNMADHGDWRYVGFSRRGVNICWSNDATRNVAIRMESLIPHKCIPDFNNAATTTHADMLGLIYRTRASFEAEFA